MRRMLKILVSAFLIAGLAAAYGISYSSATNRDLGDDPANFDGCPLYATARSIFETRSGENWARAARWAEMGGSATGSALAAPLPRNNFIDEYLFDAMATDKIPHADLCTPEEFVRRVYLDLTGRIPSAQEVKDFLANSDPMKRERLVDTLLQSPEYVDRMTMWLGDLLQIGFPPPGTFGLFHGRTAFQSYLRQAVAENKPYNALVNEMLTSTGDTWKDAPANFIARGFEQMGNPYDLLDNTASQVGSVFLGTPVICISCHNGNRHLEQVNTYLSQKNRSDLWGISAFLSGVRAQIDIRSFQPRSIGYIVSEGPSVGYDLNSSAARGGTRPERRPAPDEIVLPRYFFTGETASDSDSLKWRGELAQILTRDPQFAKATVNYLWKEFFGMGIVDPPDTFDLARTDQATNPLLLAALGQEFVDNGYDIKHMVELMVKSTAYQLSARFPGEWDARYASYFARKFPKRMTAEMIMDSIVKSSGVPNTYYVEMYPGEYREFQWAMQLPDPTEPRALIGDDTLTPEQVAANTLSRTFMGYFTRGDRYAEPRKQVGSILQTLALTNSPIVLNRVTVGQGGRIDALVKDNTLTNAQLAEELFLSTISRYPTPTEMDAAVSVLNKDRTEGAITLFLALFNKLDFIFY